METCFAIPTLPPTLVLAAASTVGVETPPPIAELDASQVARTALHLLALSPLKRRLSLALLLGAMADAGKTLRELLVTPRAHTAAAAHLTVIAVALKATVWWLMDAKMAARVKPSAQ
jgi:hypothetical protein